MLSVLFLLFSSSLSTETSFRGDFPVPPPYSVATSLPTYDEAEKAKAAAMAASAVEVMPRVRSPAHARSPLLDPLLLFLGWSPSTETFLWLLVFGLGVVHLKAYQKMFVLTTPGLWHSGPK